MNEGQTYVKKTFQGSWTQTSLNTNTLSLGLVQTLSVWRRYWKTQTPVTWCAGRDRWAWPHWGSLTLLGSGQNFRLEKFQMAFYITGNFVRQTGSAASRKSIAYNACKTWRTHKTSDIKTWRNISHQVRNWWHRFTHLQLCWSSVKLSRAVLEVCAHLLYSVGVCNLWNVVSWQRSPVVEGTIHWLIWVTMAQSKTRGSDATLLLCNSFTVRQSTVMSGNFLCLK